MNEVKNLLGSGKTRRLKFLLEANDGGVWGDDPGTSEIDVPVLRSTEQLVDGKWLILDPAIRSLKRSDFSKTRLMAGDVVITKSSGSSDHIGKTSEVTNEIESMACGFSNFMQRLRPNEQLDSTFLTYFLNSRVGREQFNLLATTTTGLGNLSAEIIGNVEMPSLPVQRQRTIAEFLNRETARLDALVTAKTQWLELLAEKRQALMTGAIIRGLDPTARLHDCGVPWLGFIPGHWEVERARWLFCERDVRSGTGEEELLTVSHITGVTPRSEKDVNMFEAETNEGYKICLAGDLVINTMWAWMGAMGIAQVNGIVSPAYNVYEPGPRLEPAYIDALVRLPLFAQEVTRYSKGVWSSRLRLYPEGFFETYLPVPPLPEQRAIVDHIANEVSKLNALRSAAEKTVDLLKERRTAIIEAAVTGQINLENAA